jgi:hypothetical protein
MEIKSPHKTSALSAHKNVAEPATIANQDENAIRSPSFRKDGSFQGMEKVPMKRELAGNVFARQFVRG